MYYCNDKRIKFIITTIKNYIYKFSGVIDLITIRKILNYKDKSYVANNILRSLPEWFAREDSIVEYVEGVKDTKVYAAYSYQKLIGFISMKPIDKITSEIYLIGVMKEFHNQGIGKKLIEEAEKELSQQNIKYIVVKTLGESHPDEYYKSTRAFYRSAGFYQLEESKTIWGEDLPCLVMKKEIKTKYFISTLW